MAINQSQPEFTDANILDFMRGHDDPCVTAGEIAEQFDVTNEAVNYRLKKLKKIDVVSDKRAGSAAKVWFTND